jgi:hypothetical protein
MGGNGFAQQERQRTVIKTLAIAAACMLAGAVAGYGFAQFRAKPILPHGQAAMTMCEPGDAQLERLAARILSATARPVAESRVPAPSPPAESVSGSERDAAYTHAAQIVDMMIANRRITAEGLEQAQALLRDSDQVDRAHEIDARIAAAVNRGEITLEQSGFPMPKF